MLEPVIDTQTQNYLTDAILDFSQIYLLKLEIAGD